MEPRFLVFFSDKNGRVAGVTDNEKNSRGVRMTLPPFAYIPLRFFLCVCVFCFPTVML